MPLMSGSEPRLAGYLKGVPPEKNNLEKLKEMVYNFF